MTEKVRLHPANHSVDALLRGVLGRAQLFRLELRRASLFSQGNLFFYDSNFRSQMFELHIALLCLKDDAYTDLYTAFATGELHATPPTVLCSVPLKHIIQENGKFCGFRFHPYLCRCRTGMVISMILFFCFSQSFFCDIVYSIQIILVCGK